VYGSALTLSTKLKVAGTTTALASAPVATWARKAGTTTWTKIAARTTDSARIASVTVKPAANTAYQWRYPGSGTHMSAVGPETDSPRRCLPAALPAPLAGAQYRLAKDLADHQRHLD